MMVVTTLVFGLLGAGQEAASGEPGLEGRPVDYSERLALQAGESGRVVVECRVSEEVRVSDCRAVAENPIGEGFGGAAIQIVNRMVAENRIAALPAGAQPGGRIVFTMPFRLEGD